MESFLLDSQNTIKSLEENLKQLDEYMKEISELYMEPLKDILNDPSLLFSKINLFVLDFNESFQRNLVEIANEDRIKRKKLILEKKKKQRENEFNY
jgi:hypothetical protein